jgi:hypothetical protein
MSPALAPRPAGRATRVAAAEVPAPRVAGVGLLTGWGQGLAALPVSPPSESAALVPVPTPTFPGERFRRTTRECVLAAAAVMAALDEAGLDAGEIVGDRTGILYVSASGYAAANRAFLEDETSTTLHFPYTAPSAVPGEVTIEFGIRGPYVNLMGGATATLQAFWYAARWLADGVADRVLVLTVETVHEVRDLFARARRLYRAPLVEGAAALLLEPGTGGVLRWASAVACRPGVAAAVASVLDAAVDGHEPRVVAPGAGRCLARSEARLLAARGLSGRLVPGFPIGEALACAPLYGLARARAAGMPGPCLVTAGWREEYGALTWPL